MPLQTPKLLLGVATTLLLLLHFPQGSDAFPSFIVNSCQRNLVVGETIMGVAVAPSTNAPADQSYDVTVVNTASNDPTASVCGQTVEQGQALVVQVDTELADAVLADGWTTALGPNFIVEATNSLIVHDGGNEIGCDNTRIVNPAPNTTVFPLQAGDLTVRLLSSIEFGQVYASTECTVTVTGTRYVVVLVEERKKEETFKLDAEKEVPLQWKCKPFIFFNFL